MDHSGARRKTDQKHKLEAEPDQDYPRPKSGPDPSVASESDKSMGHGINFLTQIGSSPDHRCSSTDAGPRQESLKSNLSKDWFEEFKDSHQREENLSAAEGHMSPTELDHTFQLLKEKVHDTVERELQKFYKFLTSDDSQSSKSEGGEEQCSREILRITPDVLREMGLEKLAERLESKTKSGFSDKLKSDLQKRFHIVFEGVAKAANSAPLSKIYTDLYIIEGEASENNQEHEVRHLERASRRPAVTETIITCENILKACPQSPEPRVVLTKGVAGVGKTVLTQKFSLDWAEGRATRSSKWCSRSLSETSMCSETNSSAWWSCCTTSSVHPKLSAAPNSSRCSSSLTVWMSADFLWTSAKPSLSDPTESVSLDVLLVNLIKGNLLPTARLWITTRHAAANLIPAECVSMVTESIRSLYIMSHIPIFCWILSTVIQKLLEQTEKPELPQTLTKMYVHFLVVQAKVQKIKYHDGSGADLHWTPETREMVLSLGKLAFEQLQKGNLIFYECDLSECGLDAKAVSKDSGVFTQVLKEESGLYQNKVYCFIHLTVQEFLAALHVHQTFFSSGENLMGTPNSSEKPESEVSFYCSAVDQALQSPNGHLDLFLRFLLGLSLPTNQKLLEGLLTQTGSNQTTEETVKYIKQKLDEKDLSAERSLNLLNCLNELDDLNPDEFDLRKYDPSETALLRLLPVVKASTKAIVSGCELSPLSCERLASVLSSSSVTYLDLSYNDLQDTGVELLCDALKNAPCRLKTLRLSGCLVSERGGAALVSVLSSSHSSLSELDVSFNHLGPSAERLKELKEDPHCPLQSVT
ncbi:hypothetical protein WMY93_026980 [Mugilogobius chulae]|uniref:FISNA domain-containing protein n=1 Tax=Mugilogobius chulae TaxID=88201 RepID=A0AAW0N3E8_9GOBI